MQPEELQQQWKEQGEEAVAAVAQWRVAHPKATLAESEQAVDEQMNRLRAQLIEQAAQASTAAESEASQGLVCEQCGQTLQARGRARGRWQTQGGQQVAVERAYVTCPHCGGGFFPPGSGTAAEWIQNFVQGHRHDALRMLDFAHAASYVNEIADKLRDSGGHLPPKWVDGVLHRLKHEGPARVLRHLRRLARRSPQIQEQVNYLRDPARVDGLSDPTFSRAGRLGLEVWRAAINW